MQYRKPELVSMGDANQVIQSALIKGPYQYDSRFGPPELTSVSAYQADE